MYTLYSYYTVGNSNLPPPRIQNGVAQKEPYTLLVRVMSWGNISYNWLSMKEIWVSWKHLHYLLSGMKFWFSYDLWYMTNIPISIALWWFGRDLGCHQSIKISIFEGLYMNTVNGNLQIKAFNNFMEIVQRIHSGFKILLLSVATLNIIYCQIIKEMISCGFDGKSHRLTLWPFCLALIVQVVD